MELDGRAEGDECDVVDGSGTTFMYFADLGEVWGVVSLSGLGTIRAS